MNCSKWIRGPALAALVTWTACASPADAKTAFGLSPIRDDGKAEFSTYTGRTERYGKARPTRARIIVVKEDLVRATMVKSEADRGPASRSRRSR